jgi:hypothetical protein
MRGQQNIKTQPYTHVVSKNQSEIRGRKIQQKMWFPKLNGSSVLRNTAKRMISENQQK